MTSFTPCPTNPRQFHCRTQEPIQQELQVAPVPKWPCSRKELSKAVKKTWAIRAASTCV